MLAGRFFSADPDRTALACRVVDSESDRWCRRCGCLGAAQDPAIRTLAHEPLGWRPTTVIVTVRRALEPWLPELRAAVQERVFCAPEIVISRLGPNATVIGAIARALAMVAEQDAPVPLGRRSLG